MKFIAVIAVALLAGGAQAATITNGSFETGPSAGNFVSLSSESTSINGWTVGGGGIDYIGSYWTASDGARSVDLARESNGSISQDITDLILGKTYIVSFDMSGNTDGAPAVKSLTVAVNEGSASYTPSSATKLPNLTWVGETFRFTAKGTSTRLTFSSTNDPSTAYGAALDNVSISAVPLPAALPLLLVALGGLGVAARRRKTA